MPAQRVHSRHVETLIRTFAVTAEFPDKGFIHADVPLHDHCSVGLKVLNDKLGEYVRLAAAGETVLVTDHDRVMAEVVPPRVERSPILADAMLAEMVRKAC